MTGKDDTFLWKLTGSDLMLLVRGGLHQEVVVVEFRAR